MLPYPFGWIIWGIPMLLISFGVEYIVSKCILNSNMETKQKKVWAKRITSLIILAILTAIYFVTSEYE